MEGGHAQRKRTTSTHSNGALDGRALPRREGGDAGRGDEQRAGRATQQHNPRSGILPKRGGVGGEAAAQHDSELGSASTHGRLR